MFLKFVFAQTFSSLYNLPHILKHISDGRGGGEGAMQIAREKIRAMLLIYKYSEKGMFSDFSLFNWGENTFWTYGCYKLNN